MCRRHLTPICGQELCSFAEEAGRTQLHLLRGFLNDTHFDVSNVRVGSSHGQGQQGGVQTEPRAPLAVRGVWGAAAPQGGARNCRERCYPSVAAHLALAEALNNPLPTFELTVNTQLGEAAGQASAEAGCTLSDGLELPNVGD